MDGHVEPVAAQAPAHEPVAALIPLQSVSFEPAPVEPEARVPIDDLTPAAAPEPSRSAPPPWRKTLIASFAGAALVSGGLGWWLLRTDKRAAPPNAPDLEMPVPATTAPATMEASAGAPVAPIRPAPAVKPARPVDLNDLTKPPAPARVKRAPRKPRARKPKVAAAPTATAGGETLIESHNTSSEPSLPGAAPAAEPPAPAQQEDRGFLLPGVPRRVPPSATKPTADSEAAPATAAIEDPTAKQVREQFVFCAQLLSQGAYADHFDTCLCADARSAAPYHGRRGYYATTLKKAAAAGTLATSAAVKGIVLDGPIARVTADWKSGTTERPRTKTESWQLEDGLWCRHP